MSEPVKIAIVLDGGLIQQVLSAGVPVEYVVVDYDTEGSINDLSEVIQFEGLEPTEKTVEAYVHQGDAEIHGPFVLHAFEL